MRSNILFGCILTLICAVVFIMSLIVYPWFHVHLFPLLSEAEIQLYMAAIALATGASSLWYWASFTSPFTRSFKDTYKHGSKVFQWYLLVSVLCVGLFCMFLFGTRVFPSGIFQSHIQEMGLKISPIFNYGIYLCLVGAWCILLFLMTLSQHPLKNVFKNIFFRLVFIAIVLLGIVILAFHVGYLSIFDQASYAGPINNLLHGIPPLTFFSWYGFLSVVFLSVIYSFVPFSLLNMTIVTAIAVTIGFFALLYVALLLYKRLSVSVLAIYCIIFSYWIVQTGLRNSLPENTILRFGFWIPVAVLVYIDSQKTKYPRITRFFLELTVAIGFFWTFDIGTYLVLSYLLYRWFSSLESSPVQTFFLWLRSIAPTALAIGTVFSLITIVEYFLYHTIPQWHYFTDGPLKFLGTFLMIPMPQSFIPWIVLSPAVICLVIVITKKRFHAITSSEKLLLFIACYSTVQFAYVLGRSSLGTIRTILPPLVLCLFWIIQTILNTTKKYSPKHTIAAVVACSFLLAYPTYIDGLQSIKNLQQENFLTTIETLKHPYGTEEEFFGSTAHGLTASYGKYIQEHGIALISVYDIWYAVILGEVNATGSDCLFCYLTPDMVAPFTKTIQDKKFRYLFIDTDQYMHMGQVSWIFSGVAHEYHFKETIGRLDVYERN